MPASPAPAAPSDAARLPWVAWLATSAVAAGAACALALAEERFPKSLGAAGWIGIVLATAPLLGAQLVLGVPAHAARVRAWLAAAPVRAHAVPALLVALFVVAGIGVGKFDPYVTAIFALAAFACLGALREISGGSLPGSPGDASGGTLAKPESVADGTDRLAGGPSAPTDPRVDAAARSPSQAAPDINGGLTWTDAAVWLAIWIPFDLRWYDGLWQGPKGFAYNWWAIALTTFSVIAWGLVRNLPGLGYRLVPTRRDVAIGLAALFAFAAFVIPVGFAIGFLHWPPSRDPSLTRALGGAVGLFLTVAIPEELFFRGLLLNGLERHLRRPWLAQVLSAVAFGLMHWNNAGPLGEKIAYCSLATVAGLFYGWAYRRSGALIAPVITHTLTDLAWGMAFQ